MSTIHLVQSHNLGLTTARERVEELGKQLEESFDVTYSWTGNTLGFERSGASGTILVEEIAVTVDVTLGLMLAAFKGEVEKQLRGFLEQNLK